MILMALDHVRDFFHTGAQLFQPDDLTRTTAAIFLTRWVTHFCAPVFMLTAGASAWLWQRNARATPRQLSLFLIQRGFWLVMLDVTALRFGMDFTFQAPLVILNVLWALGWSMVLLAFLSRLPRPMLIAMSVAVIALHNLTDAFRGGWLWKLLHQPGPIQIGSYTVIPGYPLIPWFAVMALGFCVGPIFEYTVEARRRWLIRTGAFATAGFLLLRVANVYGDPAPWRGTILSFLRVSKYPPSVEFLLMTLGPALLMLAWLEYHGTSPNGPLVTFGRVPLFYFLGHFYLAHVVALLLAQWRYGQVGFALRATPSMGSAAGLYPPGYGYGLGSVYVIWLGIVIAMYPLCIWFGRYKRAHASAWLRYF